MLKQIAEVVEFMKSNNITSINLSDGKVGVTYLEQVFAKLPKEEPVPSIEDMVEPSEETVKPIDGFTVKEVAELIGLCENSVLLKIRNGKIIATKVGNKLIVTSDNVDKYLESQKVPKGYKSIEEISSMFDYSQTHLSGLMKRYEIKNVRIGKKKFYDFDQFVKERDLYEKDILINDGHRRGPVKFKDECKK